VRRGREAPGWQSEPKRERGKRERLAAEVACHAEAERAREWLRRRLGGAERAEGGV
jgi:hypothetical protein